jgi:coenzyme F420-reducing hydrogenase gamma subunit
MNQPKPRLGVFKFASCDGCQLTVLDCEDELLTLADRVEIGYFLEAVSRPKVRSQRPSRKTTSTTSAAAAVS